MDPVTLVVVGLLSAALLVGGVIALAMWDKVLEWSQRNLIPWFEKHLPNLAVKVRFAFRRLDEVAVAVRRRIAEEWHLLRERLLKETIEIRRSSSNRWVVTTTSWIVARLEGLEPKVVRRETQEEVAWDALPDELRAAYIERNESSRHVDFTEVRDRDVAQVQMA